MLIASDAFFVPGVALRDAEAVPHNAWYTNLLLAAILLLFAIVGAQEVIGALR